MLDRVLPLVIFFFALWPAKILARVLHETGHAIAARAVGQTVLSWGVGFDKVLVRIPVGRAIFYLASPMVGGLMIAAPPSLKPSRAAEFIVAAGGNAANSIGLAAGLVLWSMGWDSSVLLSWIVVSAPLCIGGSLPHCVQMAGTRLGSDGKLPTNLVFQSSTDDIHVGSRLQSSRAITRVLDRIGQRGGVAYYRLYAAMLEATLGNLDQARSDLESAEGAGRVEIPRMAELLALTRLTIAAEANEDQAPELAQQARSDFGSDQTVQFDIDCSIATWRHARGLPIGGLLEPIRQRAGAASDAEWIATAEVVGFMANPTDNPDVRCRQIIEQHHAMLGVDKIALFTAAASALANIGKTDSAREFRAAAMAEIRREASYIDAPETRTAFTARAVGRLQSVLPHELLAVETPPDPATAVALASKGKILSRITLAFGTATFLFAAATSVWDAVWPLDKAAVMTCNLALIVGLIFAALFAIGTILRGERRTGTALAGLLLGILGIVVAAVTDVGGVRHPRSNPAAPNMPHVRQR